MNLRQVCGALACIILLGSVRLAAADKATVYLGRSGELPAGARPLPPLLLELGRQSLLVAARDELGLRTRDLNLGDEMPSGGDNAPFVVRATAQNSITFEVCRGFATSGKPLLHRELRWSVPASKESDNRQAAVLTAYPAAVIGLEKLSRSEFADVIKQAGLKGRAQAKKESARVPEEIKSLLMKLDFVSQFSAVRQLHDLIRQDGESPERLGALVRGYANLGLLTEFHWHPAHKALTARSLIYSQRMVADDKQPSRALWHRAYAFALAGLHKFALDDLQEGEKRWKADEKHGDSMPPMVELIDAYCRFAQARLKTASEEGPLKELATLLWFDSVAHSHHQASTIRAAMQALGKLPDCYPAVDALCEHGGVSVGHTATTVPFAIVAKTLYSRVADIPGLPAAALKIAEAGAEEPSKDDEISTSEFAARAKLIRALLESDRPVPPKAAETAALNHSAAGDGGEPTWVSLGQLVSNLSFVHVWRRARFMHERWNVPTEDFIRAAAPLIEAHPYRNYIATVVDNPAAQKAAWDQMPVSAGQSLTVQGLRMWQTYATRRPAAAAGIGRDIGIDTTPRDYYYVACNGLPAAAARWSAMLLWVSPFSPVGPSLGIDCGEMYKSRFDEWKKLAEDWPVIASVFARRAAAAGQAEEMEKWYKILTASGDIQAYQNLAQVYYKQGKMDQWVTTLDDSLKAPDWDLWHGVARTHIARYYMSKKQWDKALPYAKGAAEVYSDWGLQVLAEWHEAKREWDKAEAIFKAIAERYPDMAADWYAFCRRTGHGDLAAARRAATAALYDPAVRIDKNNVTCYLLEKDSTNAQRMLLSLAKQGNPVQALNLALIADRHGEKAQRDQALSRIKATASIYRPKTADVSYATLGALAGLIAEDLAKGGKGEIDIAVAERLNPPPAYDNRSEGAPATMPAPSFDYLLGRYFEQHGNPELAIRCWKRATSYTQHLADIYRTLAADELLARGIRPEFDEPLPDKPGPKAKPAEIKETPAEPKTKANQERAELHQKPVPA
jgi:hypothetical protein